MTPSTLLSPLLSYCTDLPGFSPDAVEVAETEQRIGTMLSTLHYWEQSAAEWRASAEQFRRDAALESAKRIRDCDNFASALDVQTNLLADTNAQLNAMRARVAELEARVERLTAECDRYKAWHDDVASRRLHVLQENGRVYDAIVRPKPLKENE